MIVPPPPKLTFAQQLYANATLKPANLPPSPYTTSAPSETQVRKRPFSRTHPHPPPVSHPVPPIPHISFPVLQPQLSLHTLEPTKPDDRPPNPLDFYNTSVVRSQPILLYNTPVSVPVANHYIHLHQQTAPTILGQHESIGAATRPRSTTPPQRAYPSPTPSSITSSSLAYTESPPYTSLPVHQPLRSSPSPSSTHPSPLPSSYPSPPVSGTNQYLSPPATHSPPALPSFPPFVLHQAPHTTNHRSAPAASRSASISSTATARSSRTIRSQGVGSNHPLSAAGGLAAIASAVALDDVLDNNDNNNDGRSNGILSGLEDSFQNFNLCDGGNNVPSNQSDSANNMFGAGTGTNGGSGVSCDQYGTGGNDDAYDPYSFDMGGFQDDPYDQNQCPLPAYDASGYLSYTGPETWDSTDYEAPGTDDHQSDDHQEHYQHSSQSHPLHSNYHVPAQVQPSPPAHQSYPQQSPSHNAYPSPPHTSVAQQNINHPTQSPHISHPQSLTPGSPLYNSDTHQRPTGSPLYTHQSPAGSPHYHTQRPYSPVLSSPSTHHAHTLPSSGNPTFQGSPMTRSAYSQHQLSQHTATLPPEHKPNQAFTVARPPPIIQQGPGIGSVPQRRLPLASFMPPVASPAQQQQQPQYSQNQPVAMPRPLATAGVGSTYGSTMVGQLQSPPPPPPSMQMQMGSGTGSVVGPMNNLSPVVSVMPSPQPPVVQGLVPPRPPIIQHANSYPGAHGTVVLPTQYMSGMMQPQGGAPTPSHPNPSATPQPPKDPETGINAQKIVQYAKTAASVAGVAVKIFQAAETLTGNNNTGSNNVFF